MREIACAPGYFISYDGRVFSAKRNRVLSQERTRLGYMRVGLQVGGKQKRFLVHRLVAEAFIPQTGTEINHKDGVKWNNSADNLEWSTRSDNVRHAFTSGLIKPLRGQDVHGAKLTPEIVRAIRQSTESRRTLAKRYGVTPECVSAIALGKNWRHV